MKKLAFTLALASLAIVSCSKKEEAPEQPQTESNVMLEEPKAAQENTAAASPEEEGKKTVRRSRLSFLS